MKYAKIQQKPLSRIITVNNKKSGGVTIQAVLNNQKKKINLADVQKVFTEIIERTGISDLEIRTYIEEHTVPKMDLEKYQKSLVGIFSKYEMTQRELGEGIVKDKIIAPMIKELKKGDDNPSTSGNELQDFMRNIRYTHYTTNRDSANNIWQKGLEPKLGGNGISCNFKPDTEIEKTHVEMSEGYSFVTRNYRDRSNYSLGREKLDVFVPPEINLIVDLDSYGYKCHKSLDWIGYDRKLNTKARRGFYDCLGWRYSLEQIQQEYEQICNMPTPSDQVIASTTPDSVPKSGAE